jgi:hypothetical protein
VSVYCSVSSLEIGRFGIASCRYHFLGIPLEGRREYACIIYINGVALCVCRSLHVGTGIAQANCNVSLVHWNLFR